MNEAKETPREEFWSPLRRGWVKRRVDVFTEMGTCVKCGTAHHPLWWHPRAWYLKWFGVGWQRMMFGSWATVPRDERYP